MGGVVGGEAVSGGRVCRSQTPAPQPAVLRFREVPGSVLTPKQRLWFQSNPGNLTPCRAVLWDPG